jgi:hypothetical protein
MIRERTLKVVLVILGLLFLAGIYPVLWMHPSPGEQMLGTVYVTLGFFLLLAVRDPSANRSLIAFTAWSSFTHAGIMALEVYQHVIPRADLLRAVLPLFIIGALLLVLGPAKLRMAAG